MIVNTTMLSKHIDDMLNVRRIVNRATHQMGVKTFMRMSTNAVGAIGSYTHFDLDEFIKLQEAYVLTARKDLKKDAKALLAIAKKARRGLVC